MAPSLDEIAKNQKRFSTERERTLRGIKGLNMTKKKGNLWETMVSAENLMRAYKNARKGKAHRPDVKVVDENPE